MPGEIPDTSGARTQDVAVRFNDALNRHDIDAVMALMTEDCVFENTYPPADGIRYRGQAPVRRFWEDLVNSTPDARFTTEELVAMGDRRVVRWRYDDTGGDGAPGHSRGIDLFRVRDGKVSEKLSDVKG